jgi:CRISPR-associated protein Cas5/CasD subtype I-E
MSALRGVALRLHGPLQSWGAATVGDNRPTQPFPTKSGVLGLLAGCLGIGRKDVDALLSLTDGARVHVRVDVAGTPLVDDQTIQDNPSASPTRQTIQSKRTYLCDASFVAVVVPGPGYTVERLVQAITTPVFAPFLGRRSCVPSTPLLLAAEVTGDEPLDLFATLARGPEELLAVLPRHGDDHFDYYLDVADHPLRLRRVRVRDDLAGPLPRQWKERAVVHARVQSSVTDGAPRLDPWMSSELS